MSIVKKYKLNFTKNSSLNLANIFFSYKETEINILIRIFYSIFNSSRKIVETISNKFSILWNYYIFNLNFFLTF